MGLETLDERGSTTILPEWFNVLRAAWIGSIVGRGSNGAPEAGKSLGTAVFPFSTAYIKSLNLDGLAVDLSGLTTDPNRIIAGSTRALSDQPDFLRAKGDELTVQILGNTTNLSFSVDGVQATCSTDIDKTDLSAAPSSNNECSVNYPGMTNDKYAGESDALIKSIPIDAVGTEISDLVGEYAVFETPTGELFRAFVKSSTELTDVYRGYYFNSSYSPLNRGNLSDNDTLTLRKLGYVFLEDNGTTVDVSYITPIESFVAPASVLGRYWKDLTNNTWKKYSGSSWEISNRIPIGEFVCNQTVCMASRSYDFSKSFSDKNNIELEVESSSVISSTNSNFLASVYGALVSVKNSYIKWNLTTDLESGLTEASDTTYYLYLSKTGQRIISDEKPYERKDLLGRYHPYHTWLCVGYGYNDSSSDFTVVSDYTNRKKSLIGYVKDIKNSGSQGGALTGNQWNRRDLNTPSADFLKFGSLESNQFNLIISGRYRIKAAPTAYGNVLEHRARIYDVTNSKEVELGQNHRLNSDASGTCEVEAIIEIDKPTKYEIQHRSNQSVPTNGMGTASNMGVDEVYTVVEIEKLD